MAERPMSLGDMMSRPPRGVSIQKREPIMETRQGTDKRSWLTWDGKNASISDLDTYVLRHRRRMKPCTSFDTLGMDSGENQVFGTSEHDYLHFNPAIGKAIAELKDQFPDEAKQYTSAYLAANDTALSERIYLINPMNFIGSEEKSVQAKHYRIRVGASDADTSLSVAMTLAIKLQNAGLPVEYALVWDQPHSEADYPGEVLQWIDEICSDSSIRLFESVDGKPDHTGFLI